MKNAWLMYENEGLYERTEDVRTKIDCSLC
jgi:hypothetical protein